MKTEHPLAARDREILAMVVRTHITTGAPVPSAEVARRHGKISPATVRSIMGKLEERGYLHQPHTSAGRVPTLQAFEQFARLMASQARLSTRDRSRIDSLMTARQQGAEELLGLAPHALSEFCRGVGLLVLLPLSQTVLNEIRFVPLSGRRVLVVAMAQSGLVRDKVVRTHQRYTRDELARMTAYINQHFRHWTLDAIRQEMERRVATERSHFLQQALELCEESFDAAPDPASLHLEGLARLLEQAGASDPEAFGSLLQALDEKERLAEFLADCVEAPDAPVRIQVGLENFSPAMKDFALIGKSCGGKQHPLGWLGFLGPARMDYGRAITAVRYVAGLLDHMSPQN